MAVLHNMEYLRPPVTKEEFSDIVHEADMRSNYRADYLQKYNNLFPCSCNHPGKYDKMIEAINTSEEMKGVKLLSYAKKLESKGCVTEVIKSLMSEYNNNHDKLSAHKVEYIYDLVKNPWCDCSWISY
ncbi:MAG: hypothetical protein WAK17_11300 [Candidatus Nitrosopolaris sp.]|jgi:hypothetical protein